MISDIPFNGPVAAVRVGYVDGKLVFNPTSSQMEKSILDLRLAGTNDSIIMVEAGASEVTEELMLDALQQGHRSGGVHLPVEVAFKFAGRPVERQPWDGRGPVKVFRFVRPERLEWVDIDPDRKIALDVNWMNNGRRLEPDARPAASWASRWLFLLQNLVTTLGLL